MRILGLTPMLRTWDLPRALAFYTHTLDFTCTACDQEAGWAHLAWDGATLMLSGPNAHEGDQKPAFTGSLYLRVQDVEALWIRLKDQARICYPMETFPYGMREFAVFDPDGYLIQFGEEIPEP